MINKIEKIFLSFYTEDSSDPRLWAIGTDFHKSWLKFAEEIKKNNIPCDTVREIEVVKSDLKPNLGQIFINGVNVTPVMSVKNAIGLAWSDGAIRQFLQHGSALNIIFWDPSKGIYGKWLLSSEFLKYIYADTDFSSTYINLIFKGTNSSVNYCKNLSFTLFCALIYKKDANIFDMLKNTTLNNRIIKKMGQQKNLINHHVSSTNSMRTFFEGGIKFNDKSETVECFNRTYSSVVSILLSGSFEKIIDRIFYSLNAKKDFITTEKLNYKNVVEMVHSMRGAFREVLFCARVPKNANKYCDLVSKITNKEIPTSLFQLDAAHIFEVNQIIENISSDSDFDEKNLNDIKKQILDVNNGLLLPTQYHRAFDRGVIGFNVDGHLITRSNLEFDGLHIEESYIKREVFNEEMKKYFSKR